eukprot:scaffold36468_cov172-Skeletonema_dohrnii-CCMP3373.AAC.1
MEATHLASQERANQERAKEARANQARVMDTVPENQASRRVPREVRRDLKVDHMMVAMDIPTTILYLESQASPRDPREVPREARVTMVAIIKSSPPPQCCFVSMSSRRNISNAFALSIFRLFNSYGGFYSLALSSIYRTGTIHPASLHSA